MYADNPTSNISSTYSIHSETDLCLGVSGIQLAGPDMLVDEYSQYNNDQQDVVDIPPNDTPEEPAEAEIMADDCMFKLIPRSHGA